MFVSRNSLGCLFSSGSNRVEEGRLARFDFNIRTKNRKKEFRREKGGGD